MHYVKLPAHTGDDHFRQLKKGLRIPKGGYFGGEVKIKSKSNQMAHSILKKQCSTKLQLKRREEDERLVDRELQLSTWKLGVKSCPETKTLIIYIK